LIGWLTWSGDSDWTRVQAELRAKGEKLTFAELIPPPPPDSENFFADPIWQELADLVPVTKNNNGAEYQTWEPRLPEEQRQINQWMTPLSAEELEQFKKLIPDPSAYKFGWKQRFTAIKTLNQQLTKTTDFENHHQMAHFELELMKPAEPLLAKITELSKRLSSSFPVRDRNAIPVPLSHISAILSLGQLLSAKSLAELELGATDSVSADILTLLRLSRLQDNEPLLISFIVRQSMISTAKNSIIKGIEYHAWNDEQLVEFQQKLEAIQLRSAFCFALRGERSAFNKIDTSIFMTPSINGSEFFNAVSTFLFSQLLNESKASYALLMQRYIERLQQNPAQGINTETLLFAQEVKILQSHPIKKWLDMLEALTLPVLDTCVEKTIETQTQVNQTLIACALERYRLAQGSYPASLEILIPAFLSAIPKEPTTGNPMHYRLLADGKFLLWAPGWKLQTRDGKPGEFQGEGDIVWNLPLPHETRAATAR
jgi:hypothetical protein